MNQKGAANLMNAPPKGTGTGCAWFRGTVLVNQKGSADLMSAPPGQKIFSAGKEERRRNSGALSRFSDAARRKKNCPWRVIRINQQSPLSYPP